MDWAKCLAGMADMCAGSGMVRAFMRRKFRCADFSKQASLVSAGGSGNGQHNTKMIGATVAQLGVLSFEMKNFLVVRLNLPALFCFILRCGSSRMQGMVLRLFLQCHDVRAQLRDAGADVGAGISSGDGRYLGAGRHQLLSGSE